MEEIWQVLIDLQGGLALNSKKSSRMLFAVANARPLTENRS
jgi:hypothetical protein